MRNPLIRRAAILTVAGAALLATSLPGGQAASHLPGLPTTCTDGVDEAITFELPVGDTVATGRYALPASDPVGIVAMFHGYGHTSSSWAEHLKRTARDLNVIAVAMDYRGTTVVSTSPEGIESSRGWRVREGAEETNVAVRQLAAQCPTAVTRSAFGVSMGGNASGLAVAAEPKTVDGAPLYDWWFNIEGATDPIDTYLSARTLAPANATARNAAFDIAEEAGGCEIEVCPKAYEEMAVITKAGNIRNGNLKGAIFVHGLDDGLVGPQHSVKMRSLLRAVGVPYDMYTVGTRGSGEAGTTLTGYAGGFVPGYQSPLAGHASERSTTHLVMKTAFQRLAALYSGTTFTGYNEHVVDGAAGNPA